MLKRSSDALQLTTYTRRTHFVYGVFEYLLVIVVTLCAIALISSVFIGEFSNLMENNSAILALNSFSDSQ
ncbi:hypothetical protein [uncultured Bartonella sp.]|uniref:hypothetical protein n=1 Tax=uncultured Bartonella sp. TaxID=104108 RepID=UPI002607F9C1|nr:hypothetical protein [uncultured Bartonella sp.]